MDIPVQASREIRIKVYSESTISKRQGKNVSMALIMKKSDQGEALVWEGTNNPYIGGGMPFNFLSYPCDFWLHLKAIWICW